MNTTFGQLTVSTLRQQENVEYRRLRRSAAFAADVPSRFTKWIASYWRRQWVQFQSDLTQSLSLGLAEQRLREKLYLKHLYLLHGASDLQIAVARRRLEREFAARRVLILLRMWCLQLLWNAGRAADRAWHWLSTHRPFEFINFSWRATVISISTIALFGWSVWAAYEFEWVPPETAVEGAPKEPPPALPKPVMVFPLERMPVHWQIGSAQKLYSGYDRRSGSIASEPNWRRDCMAAAIVVFGTASLEGSDAANDRIARNRASALGAQGSRTLSTCAERPKVLMVAMSRPHASVGDGAQRKAFAVSVYVEEGGDESASALLSMAITGIDPALGDYPSTYRFKEACFRSDVENPCDWLTLD